MQESNFETCDQCNQPFEYYKAIGFPEEGVIFCPPCYSIIVESEETIPQAVNRLAEKKGTLFNFSVGDRVRILETAFPESDDPIDVFARGKIGTIIIDLSKHFDGYEDCYEVELDNVPDGMIATFPVEIHEIEKV